MPSKSKGPNKFKVVNYKALVNNKQLIIKTITPNLPVACLPRGFEEHWECRLETVGSPACSDLQSAFSRSNGTFKQQVNMSKYMFICNNNQMS